MLSTSETSRINHFKQRVENELFNDIIPFWIKYVPDTRHGGFHGRITNDNKIVENANKGLILHARLLWTFSALYDFKPEKIYIEIAERAYSYLVERFQDEIYGGMYWVLDYTGAVVDDTKKMYGQAFTIYALAEYYRITQNKEVLNLAKSLFNLIEEHNFDKENTGYFEASHRDWSVAKDIALSEVDMVEQKSMNTHLHLMEAYTNLYKVWPDVSVGNKLRQLINNFIDYILDKDRFQLKLFFNEKWQVKSQAVSFGHDIEFSWLLSKAVDALDDEALRKKMENTTIQVVDATISEGLSAESLIYAEKKGAGTIDKSMDWWQQAEAIVGFINAYEITEEQRYLNQAINCWDAVEKYLVDREHGEWFFALLPDHKPDLSQYKVSEWKGPYHNTRACLEILRRVDDIL